MTPAIDRLRALGIPHTLHEYTHDPATTSYGLEAAEQLGADPERVYKTLVVRLDKRQLAVGIVPVSGQLNLKRMAQVCAAAEHANDVRVDLSIREVFGVLSNDPDRTRAFLAKHGDRMKPFARKEAARHLSA